MFHIITCPVNNGNLTCCLIGLRWVLFTLPHPAAITSTFSVLFETSEFGKQIGRTKSGKVNILF